MATGFKHIPPIGMVDTIEGIELGLEKERGNAILLRDPITGLRTRIGYNSNFGAGTVETVSGLTVEELGNGINHKTILSFSAVSLAMTDASSAQSSGSQKIYTFPQALVSIQAAVISINATKSGSGISTTFAGLVSLGTAAAAADATLTGTEANVVPSTVTAAATAGVSAVNAVNTAAATLNGAASALALYYNQLINDADSSASGTLSLTGTIVLHWINGGSY